MERTITHSCTPYESVAYWVVEGEIYSELLSRLILLFVVFEKITALDLAPRAFVFPESLHSIGDAFIPIHFRSPA